MPLPEVIVFDLGKVMVDFDYGIAARRIADRSPATVDVVRGFLDQATLLVSYECGHMSTEEFYKTVAAGTGFQGTLEEFSQFFADIFTPIEEMVQLHERFRQLGFPTYIFSNTNDLAIRHIQAAFPFYNQFTEHILSYEHGAMKPDGKLYEVVESRSKRSGPAILYLDDRAENVAAGRERQWQVILQETPAKTLRQIELLGLL